jgi:Ca2+-binding RTX toxin-like protein
MGLVNWPTKWFPRPNRAARRAGNTTPKVLRKPRGLVIESLEDRLMPSTTLFIDFAQKLNAGVTGTATQLRNLDQQADGTPITDTGPDLSSIGAFNTPAGANVTVQTTSLGFDYDGNGTKGDAADVTKLQDDVVAIVAREYAPFDVEVKTAASADLNGIRTTLHANDAATDGKFDAYVLVGTYSSNTAGGSIAAGTGTYGLTATKDLFAYAGNKSDEAVAAFADEVLHDTPNFQKVVNGVGGPATADELAAFRTAFAYRLAYTIGHEAAHSFGLAHTDSTQTQVNGDGIAQSSNTRETNNIFTRFSIPLVADPSLHIAPGTLTNNYNSLRNDPDIGLVDADRNNVPDFAYVTGTGGNDRITITPMPPDAAGRTRVHVKVEALTAPLGTLEYDITVGLSGPNANSDGTDGPIRVDASTGDDQIIIDPGVTLDVTVYGGDGNDTIQGGGGNEQLFGEKGNDSITGGAGNDAISGGEGNDTLSGGAGDDLIAGFQGNDSLSGDAGSDTLIGGAGNDTLGGGTENDILYGSEGDDLLNGDAGNDELWGGSGADTLNGGDGIDTLRGGDGIDVLDGGPGADEIHNPDLIDTIVNDPADHIIVPLQLGPAPAPNNVASASGLLSPPQVSAIKAGLQQVLTWADAAGGQLATGPDTVGSILRDTLQRGLVNDVTNYLNSPSPTMQGLVAILKQPPTANQNGLAVTTTNVDVVTAADGSPRFDLNFRATRTSTTTIDLAKLGAEQQGLRATGSNPIQVPLESRVGFDLSFGLTGSTFYIKLPAAGVDVFTNIHAGGINFPAAVGLLNADASNGRVDLSARVTLTPKSTAAGGVLTATELSAGATVSQAGTLAAEIPLTGQVDSDPRAAVLTVIDNDLSDNLVANPTPAQLPVAGLAGSPDVQALARVNAFAVLEWLKQLGDRLDQVAAAAQLAASVPFTDSLKLKDVADFATTFRTKVIDRIVNADGTPNFSTAQELIDRLAAVGGPSALELSFDPRTKELTFGLNFEKVFNLQSALAVSQSIPHIAGLQLANALVQLTSTVTGGVTFSINLATPIDESQPSAVLDRFTLRNASFDAKVTAGVTGVTGSARLGVFELGVDNGGATVNLGVSLRASGSLTGLTLTPTVSGSANVNLPVHLAAQVGGITLPVNTGIVIDWANVTDPATLSASLSPAVSLSGLVNDLESVAIGQVIEGVKRVVSFLRDVQSRGIFQQKIPVLNRSLADLLDTSEKLDALSRELETNPPQTIGAALDRINALLGSAAAVTFQNRVLEFDLRQVFSKTLDLALNLNLDDSLNAGILKQFVDVNASAPTHITIGGSAALNLVIDLSNPTAPVFAIKDNSGVTVSALVNAANINLEAAIGPLGVFVQNGHIRLDNGTQGQAATFTVGLTPSTTGRYTLGDLIGNPGGVVQTSGAGKLDADLPIAFPTVSQNQGRIHLSIDSLGNIPGTTHLDTAVLPDFAGAIGNLNVNDLIGLVVEGLDRALGQIEKRFNLPNVPLIGGDLSKATAFLHDIRQKVIAKLETLSQLTADAVQAKLFEALGPSGLGLLVKRSGTGPATASDITVTFSTTEKRVEISFLLAGSYTVNSPSKLDLGLPGLGLNLNATPSFTVHLDRFDVGFGVSARDGFYFLTGAAGSAPELQISVEAAVSGPNQLAQLMATLGFLKFTATDTPVVQPDGGLGSYVSGILSLDLIDPGTGTQADGRLTLGELQSASLDDVLKTKVDLDANVQLKLTASLGSSNFPRVESDFKFQWKYHTGAADNGVQTVGFQNVRVNLGDFITNTLGPILNSVGKALSPFKTIADALTTPIEFLKGLGFGDVSIADFLGISGSSRKFLDTVRLFSGTVGQINGVLNGVLSPADAGWLTLGSFTVDGATAADPTKLGKLNPNSLLSTNLDAQDQANLAALQADTGFGLPILSNPSSIFSLILGKDVPLVTYVLPSLNFHFGYDQFISIVGPLGVRLTGDIDLQSSLKLGFDTRGLREFVSGGFSDPSLILDGLYISDTENADGTGKDVPELTLTGGLKAFAAVNVGFLEFGGGGGLTTQVTLDLKDYDHDGKVYFSQIADAFTSLSTLGSLVDIKGQISAGLSVYARIPYVYTYEKTIAQKTLYSFEITSEPTPVLGELDAQGVLHLNMGSRAGLRLYRGETVDGDEQFTITPGANTNSVVVNFKGYSQPFSGVTKIVADGGLGNDVITVNAGVVVPVDLRGGDGNDQLTAGGGPATLSGGAGDDTLVAGAAAAVLNGDDGNDVLTGGAAADVLSGGAGNDTLSGGASNDTLSGGVGDDVLSGDAGNDTITGDDGNDSIVGGIGDDTIDGGAGRDTLSGGDGNDVLTGGDDNDLLSGDAGNDSLNGNAGDDVVYGGIGNDTLLGESGNDQLYGESDNDSIVGGIGDDTLSGGAGNDELHGGVGADVLSGDAGADSLFGETGADQLFGGDGDDTLDGGTDSDELSGGAGNDLLRGGGGDDRLYGFGFLVMPDGSHASDDQSPDGNDTLLGGDGNDSLFGGQGNDVLQGEVGADLIDGQSGDDRIQYAVDLVDPNADTLRGGPQSDVVEILGTDAADDLTAQQISPTTFQVTRRDVATGAVTSTFQFSLPANPSDRDIELLQVSGLGGNDMIRLLGTFNINRVQVDGGAGDDLIVGSDGDDLLIGGVGNDTIQGMGGQDEIHGGDGNDSLSGGDGNDAIYGEAGNDSLDGGADFDYLQGGLGNDTLVSGSGSAGGILFGDFESETTADGQDLLIGDDGQDVMYGGGGDDRIEGRGGDDVITAGSGNDVVLGEAGNDVISGGAGNDTLMGGIGGDVIDGGSGNDRLYAVSDTSIADPTRPAGRTDILLGLDGDDTLRGSDQADRLSGGSGNDTFEHTPGDDTVFGGTDPANGPDTPVPNELDKYLITGTEGDDTISLRLTSSPTGQVQVAAVVNGVAVNATHSGIEVVGIAALGGNDTITVDFGQNAAMKVDIDAGAGNDLVNASTFQNDATIRGGLGNDTLTGGAGNDLIDGGDDNDVIDGGSGSDTLLGGVGNDAVTGGLGNDLIDGGDGNDVVDGGVGNDTVMGGIGNDTLTGGDGNDSIDGGAGTDTLVESTPGTAYLNYWSLQRYIGSTVFTDTLAGLEAYQLTGGDGDDTLSAGVGQVTLIGGAGNDTLNGPFVGNATLIGGDGNDSLVGGYSNDVIDGGAGDDTITGYQGNDTLIGGTGNDRLVESASGGAVLTDTQLIRTGTDVISGFEYATLTGSIFSERIDASGFTGSVTIYGYDGNDTLIGGAGADQLYGGTGDDVLVGNGGDDQIYGEDGNDALYGGVGNDTLDGGTGNDYVIGDVGNDYMFGEDGNDTLSGGDGNDTILGGTGSDYLYGDGGDDFLDGGGDSTVDYLNGGLGSDYCAQHYTVNWYYNWSTGTWYSQWVAEDQITDF